MCFGQGCCHWYSISKMFDSAIIVKGKPASSAGFYLHKDLFFPLMKPVKGIKVSDQWHLLSNALKKKGLVFTESHR